MREIKFVNWNCYIELPGRDGDLFIYDAVAMSALVDKGYLHQLPETIDVDDMFSWTIDKSKVRQKTYGVPLMACSNALICRREDDREIRNIMDLHEPVAVPLASMIMYYYLQAFCNYQNEPDKCARILKHLAELNGGRDSVDRSSLADYDAFFRMLLSEENGVLRYGARFYEDFYNRGDALLNSLKELDTWLPSIRDLNGQERSGTTGNTNA